MTGRASRIGSFVGSTNEKDLTIIKSLGIEPS